jgi:hypothetical protein
VLVVWWVSLGIESQAIFCQSPKPKAAFSTKPGITSKADPRLLLSLICRIANFFQTISRHHQQTKSNAKEESQETDTREEGRESNRPESTEIVCHTHWKDNF